MQIIQTYSNPDLDNFYTISLCTSYPKKRVVTQIEPQQSYDIASINVSRRTDSSTPLFPWSVYRSP